MIRRGDIPDSILVVPCAGKHDAEVFFIGDVWKREQAYPGEKAVVDQFTTHCEEAFKAYVGLSIGSSVLSFAGTVPSRVTWPTGDRPVGCIAYDPKAELLGTVNDSRRWWS